MTSISLIPFTIENNGTPHYARYDKNSNGRKHRRQRVRGLQLLFACNNIWI